MPKKKKASKPKSAPSFLDQIRKHQAATEKDHLDQYDTGKGRKMAGEAVDSYEE